MYVIVCVDEGFQVHVQVTKFTGIKCLHALIDLSLRGSFKIFTKFKNLAKVSHCTVRFCCMRIKG